VSIIVKLCPFEYLHKPWSISIGGGKYSAITAIKDGAAAWSYPSGVYLVQEFFAPPVEFVSIMPFNGVHVAKKAERQKFAAAAYRKKAACATG
jgi:hypothetical protein